MYIQAFSSNQRGTGILITEFSFPQVEIYYKDYSPETGLGGNSNIDFIFLIVHGRRLLCGICVCVTLTVPISFRTVDVFSYIRLQVFPWSLFIMLELAVDGKTPLLSLSF